MVENKVEGFGSLIRDLRLRMENDAQKLKKLEERGSENDANDALWIANWAWNGDEYRKIEQELRNRGHKSGW